MVINGGLYMEERFQVLSLDGGGIKGIFSAAVLAAIEEDLRVKVVDLFDLIVGTSTGGIIAIGLGLGLSPAQMVEFYFEMGPRIFPKYRWWKKRLRQALRPLYSPINLQKALRDRSVLGDRLLGDSSKSLVIPSYSLSEDGVYLFKTDHHPRLRRDWKVPAWQVAMATAAAPTYFRTARQPDNLRLIDGGVWANNPAMVGVTEAAGVFKVPLEHIRVLSLGTTSPISRKSLRFDTGGCLQWMFGITDVFLRGQSLCAANQAGHLLEANNFLRLDPPVEDGVFALDGTGRSSELIAKARFASRELMPSIERVFGSHRAMLHVPHRSDDENCADKEI